MKLGNNGEYRWMGSGKALKYKDWAPGEPDPQFNDGPESCINIFAPRNGVEIKWNANRCAHQLYFICEQEQIEFEYCK